MRTQACNVNGLFDRHDRCDGWVHPGNQVGLAVVPCGCGCHRGRLLQAHDCAPCRPELLIHAHAQSLDGVRLQRPPRQRSAWA